MRVVNGLSLVGFAFSGFLFAAGELRVLPGLAFQNIERLFPGEPGVDFVTEVFGIGFFWHKLLLLLVGRFLARPAHLREELAPFIGRCDRAEAVVV